MTNWEINVPFRDASAPLVEIGPDDLAVLGPGEREVARHLVDDLVLTDGLSSVADALSYLDQAGDSGRRLLLDRARSRAGFPTTVAVDEAERRRAAPIVKTSTVIGDPVDFEGRLLQTCGEPGCPAYPIDEHGGLIGSDAIRWYCEQHRAGHEDELKPRQAGRIVFQQGGGFEFAGAVQSDAEHGQRADEFRLRAIESRRHDRAAEYALLREAEQPAPSTAELFTGPGWSGKA